LALILDVAVCVACGPIEIDDPDIQGMCRIELGEYRAVQPFIRPDGAEFRAAKHGPFPLGHLDPPHAANAHVVLPTEPVIGGSLATSQGRRKRAPFLPSTLADIVWPDCVDASPGCLADGCHGGKPWCLQNGCPSMPQGFRRESRPFGKRSKLRPADFGVH